MLHAGDRSNLVWEFKSFRKGADFLDKFEMNEEQKLTRLKKERNPLTLVMTGMA